MRSVPALWCAIALWTGRAAGSDEEPAIRLMTLDPGHFHAALFQKEMLPGVSRRVDIYAPLGPDLVAHIERILGFNARPAAPTGWELEIHAGPDPLGRMLRERPGNVVVISGRNGGKIARIRASIDAGLHVLADKPWIIEASEEGSLAEALEAAGRRGVVVRDAMTQRFEITCILGRELAGDPAVFGTPRPGSPAEPAVEMESLHHLLKRVAGRPSRRPAWFFDPAEQGEGLADVGTHLVDRIAWTLFPARILDAARDVEILAASRWPTPLTREEFALVTGEGDFPPSLREAVDADGRLRYACNDRVLYSVAGVHVRLDVRWAFEAPPGGGDTERAVFRGSRSRLEVRGGAREGFVPEVWVIPERPAERRAVRAAVEARLAALGDRHPGLGLEESDEGLRILIPAALRIGHEAHFALLGRGFLDDVRDARPLTPWEEANMLAKYRVTTGGVALARSPRPSGQSR